MLLVFPADPTSPRRVDPAFAEEADLAKSVGFAIGFATLDLGDLQLKIPEGSGPALYRGWMLSIEDYAKLEAAIAHRGYALVNDAKAYRHCHHLPEWYDVIGGAKITPRSIWFPGTATSFEMASVVERVRAEFGASPVILKDYVKSRKHEWSDACFIASASDGAEVERVASNFLRLQDDAFVGGLVFREFVAFKQIGLHSKSHMPLVREFRFFCFDGNLVTQAPYWGEGNYEGTSPGLDVIASVLPLVRSRFFAIDVAQKEDGTWFVMELNDGGTAGVPEGGSAKDFYAGLQRFCEVGPAVVRDGC